MRGGRHSWPSVSSWAKHRSSDYEACSEVYCCEEKFQTEDSALVKSVDLLLDTERNSSEAQTPDFRAQNASGFAASLLI